ncbi:DUF6924 domain-containing protein [Streptomyces sp. HUAS TT20]|uniref:DUF6924 domain-containing protein n=1 Tax=Streptomyces sp. HUAS TT20 TaxID=3447509 RepID=UPI0021D84446|nr:hypothetical protein [Streptomyces sp. HUAS 15-9]UXY32377.1 hypothetical protein N8I87_41745 [Streptomyces sp. HUAS 15-9]
MQWARFTEYLRDREVTDEVVIDQVEILDDEAYAGLDAAALLRLVERGEDSWPQHTVLLVADEETLSGGMQVLAVCNQPHEDDPLPASESEEPFRIVPELLSAFAAQMNLANSDFFEIRREVGEDGVLRKL